MSPPTGAPKVVFVAHAADRTGPPCLLLQQMRWLDAHTDWDLHLVLLRGGDLLEEFRTVASVVVTGEPTVGRIDDPDARRVEEERAARRRSLLAHLDDADLVYINTAWSIHGLRDLPPSRTRPVIAAVHELDHDLRDGMPPRSLADLLGLPDHLIAGAPVIGRLLVEEYAVPPDRVTVLTEAIEIPDDAPSPPRSDLDLRDDALLVVGAGRPAGRKGTDLFVQLGWHLERLAPELDVQLVWFGLDAADPDAEVARDDIERLGQGGRVSLRPPTDQLLDVLRHADVFALTSREDASPLVALEAAAVGTPIVCFDVGGTPDLVADDAGIVVAYPDVDAFAAALAELGRDPERRRLAGATAARRVRARHDIRTAGPLLAQVLEAWLP